jgi:hypothetical protein
LVGSGAFVGSGALVGAGAAVGAAATGAFVGSGALVGGAGVAVGCAQAERSMLNTTSMLTRVNSFFMVPSPLKVWNVVKEAQRWLIRSGAGALGA